MKKFFSVFLCLIMILSFSLTSSANYRDPVDGIKMKAGLNPVIMHVDKNHFQYALYAVDMENMTNADLIVKYADNMMVESFENADAFSACYNHDTGSQVNVSFIYTESCQRAEVKLFIITFEYTGEFVAPEVEVSHLAGTFIKKIHAPVTVKYDGKNELSEKKTLGDVDLNGKITASDARLALRYSAKLEKLTQEQLRNADVNKDKKVTSSDARIILRVSAGLEKGFNTDE